MVSTETWTSFAQDPRRPEHAGLRASDRDRDVVREVLTEAYAEGRLDRAELDERVDALARSRVLGDLPPLLVDLVPERTPVRQGPAALVDAGPEELQRMAVERYERRRQQAAVNALVPSLICLIIYLATNAGGFFWPAFVFIGTSVPLLHLVLGRTSAIAEDRQRLERKQEKARRRELEGRPAEDPEDPQDK